MRSGLLSAGFGLATLASAATARAGDATGSDAAGSGETIVVIGRAPNEAATDRDRALDDAPFVTIVHPDDYPPAQSVAGSPAPGGPIPDWAKL